MHTSPSAAGFQGSSTHRLTYNCLPIRNLLDTYPLGSFPSCSPVPSLAKTWNLPGSSRSFQLFTSPSLAEAQNEITITWAMGALFSQNVIQDTSDHDPDPAGDR